VLFLERELGIWQAYESVFRFRFEVIFSEQPEIFYWVKL